MKYFFKLLIALNILSSCNGGGWTAQDQKYMDEHCRGSAGSSATCDMGFTKESSKDRCSGTIVPSDCLNKEDPNKGGGGSRPDGGTDPSETSSSQSCQGAECPGGLGTSGLDGGKGNSGTGPGNGGRGIFTGSGAIIDHWGDELSHDWEAVKSELNGSNAEKRRRAREGKKLLNEARDVWAQLDGHLAAILEDRAAIESSWGLLQGAWAEFGLATRDQDLSAFRGRYNSRTHSILDGVPVADPSVFDGLGKGRGDGVYPEFQKVQNGRKYLKYAHGKLEQNRDRPDYQARKTLLEFGDACLDNAEDSYRAGNVQEGNAWHDMGIGVADAVLSFIPIVGWVKDVYEARTGKGLLDGHELTKFERTMAIVGAVTVGVAKFGALAKAGKLLGVMATTAKTADEAEKVAQAGKKAVEIVESASKAPGLIDVGADSVKIYAEASIKYGKSSGEVADSLKSGKGLFGSTPKLEKSTLNDAQLSNLNRFEKKLPTSSDPITLHTVNNGAAFIGEVPGRVPGSKAVYEKVVDTSGSTLSYTKTTYAPTGSIVHIKDKIDDSIILFGE